MNELLIKGIVEKYGVTMLLDHFHSPLKETRHWHSFHSAWATYLAADLNRQLPEGWFAEPTAQFGIEIDVATFDERDETEAAIGSGHSTTESWSPPAPLATVPFPIIVDEVNVKVYSNRAGPILAGAIELISPSNKDRPESRRAFVSKCEALLHDAVGLVIVDVVTDRQANRHSLLLQQIDAPADDDGHAANLYVAAYRSTSRNEQSVLDVWYEVLQVGGDLPSMPLFLKDGPRLQVDLASTYFETTQQLRIAYDESPTK